MVATPHGAAACTKRHGQTAQRRQQTPQERAESDAIDMVCQAQRMPSGALSTDIRLWASHHPADSSATPIHPLDFTLRRSTYITLFD